MKYIISILIVFFPLVIAHAQENLCGKNIINGNQVYEKNEIEKYYNYDFSNLWLKTENESVYGIIGDDHKRLLLKIISVERNLNNATEYLVYGKSDVTTKICSFVGVITITKIQEFKNKNYGVDDEYENYEIKNQGLITAKYEFFEDKNQNHSGQFYGVLQSKWYLDKEDVIRYNDINLYSDGYFNNSFIGKWKMNNSITEKICNWGDFRVPATKCDFDIGVAEINISEKYLYNGWWVKPRKEWWK